MIGGSSDLALMLGATETGWDPFSAVIDAADGGPQKRRRAREANRLAAEATAEAAKLTKEANALAKMTDPSGLAVVAVLVVRKVKRLRKRKARGAA